MAINKVVYGNETLIDLTDDTATADVVADGYTLHLANGTRATGTAKYAGSATAGGTAYQAESIPYGQVDDNSTATAFTATVSGISQLVDGTTVMLKNGVVTSASGFTININGLGAKPVYNNMAAATRDTTIFNVNYTMLFVYDEDRVEGGCWVCYRGYDANTNTIGYQVRTNSSTLPAVQTGYRYRLWLTSADGQGFVPINTSTSTNATTARTLNTTPIDPFGVIVYNSTNGTVQANANLAATTIWQQYALTIGYSYVKTLTYPDPVYLKCTPQSNGSAVMADIVQALPTTEDGYIYIFLGRAYSATAMELTLEHPVYYYKDGAIRLWTNAAASGASVDPATATPLMDGTGAIGTSAKYAREDHVHPSDTNKVDTTVIANNITTGSIANQGDSIAITSITGNYAAGTVVGSQADDAYIMLRVMDADGRNTLTVTPTETIISNIVTPTANTDAANKQYVDNAVSGISIPTKTSDLTNDSGFITASGAPVQSVNGQTGAVTLTIPTVPTVVSSFTNDAGYLTLATLPVYDGTVTTP